MLNFIYFSGGFFAIYSFYLIFSNRKYHLPEKLLLFSVSIIPLGKLIYLPVPSGFYGLKFQFLMSIIVSLIWITLRGLSNRAVILLVLTCIAGMSLGWLEDPRWLGLYSYVEKAGYGAGQETGTSDSAALRILAFSFLVMYSASIATALKRNEELLVSMSHHFVIGTIVSSIIGSIIFICVWNGLVSIQDLLPISVDLHIIESENNFYRFNPGANVNEFSMILTFALILLFFVKWNNRIKFLVILFLSFCLLATLTRSSWLGIVVALSIGFITGSKNKKYIYKLLGLFIFISFVIFSFYLFSDLFKYLIETRFAMNIGDSGEERLIKYNFVFNRLFENHFRLLFGYGWSSNLYVHSVFLQLLYEIGFIGFLLFFIIFYFYFKGIFLIPPGHYKIVLISLIVFIIISASMQHSLYHVQTWFILGLISGCISFLKKNFRKYD